jgi:transcriptional regulator with XRE-family HTH domain
MNASIKQKACLWEVAKVDKTRQLSIQQQNAIDLLVQGKSDRETAEAIGVSRQTVTNWRNNNTVFIAELNKRRKAVWGAQVDRIRYLISAALDVLEEDLKDADNKQLRQKAAIHILQAVGLYGQSLKPDGEDTPEGVEAQKRHEEAFKELTMLG